MYLMMLLHLKLLDNPTTSQKRTFYQRPRTVSPMDKLTAYFLDVEMDGREALKLTSKQSYSQRYVFVFAVIIIAFITNTLIGRILEKLKMYILRRIIIQPEDTEDISFILGCAFEFVNLTITALLAWEVYDIANKVLHLQNS